MSVDAIRAYFEGYPWWAYSGTVVLVSFLLSWLVFVITRRYLIRALSNLTRRSESTFDDAILENVISNRLAHIAPVLVLYAMLYWVPEITFWARPLLLAVIVLIILLSIGAFLNQTTDFLQQKSYFRDKPVKSYGQVLKLIIYLLGTIIIVGIVTNSSPLTLLSGLGAMTAVLLFIFRDTILSLIASIQITAYDLVRVGDWIEVRKYGADGDVIDISLHTVKIQNWDKTITIIPTHKLIDETFINWRGMQQSGGRRIKRAIHIDINSIRICDERMLEEFRKIRLINEYIESKEKEIDDHNQALDIDDGVKVNGRRLTNIGTFRAYVTAYLRNHERINHDLTFLIRQLPPGNMGVPIEVYAFTNDTVWANYEAIQADIFDHLLSIVPEFSLRVFQDPSGMDFRNISQQPSA